MIMEIRPVARLLDALAFITSAIAHVLDTERNARMMCIAATFVLLRPHERHASRHASQLLCRLCPMLRRKTRINSRNSNQNKPRHDCKSTLVMCMAQSFGARSKASDVLKAEMVQTVPLAGWGGGRPPGVWKGGGSYSTNVGGGWVPVFFWGGGVLVSSRSSSSRGSSRSRSLGSRSVGR